MGVVGTGGETVVVFVFVVVMRGAVGYLEYWWSLTR